ncbi:MAG TPA: hypothetical protein VGC92_13040 [Phenylobacterium sp.]|jgi:hypothetical protein
MGDRSNPRPWFRRRASGGRTPIAWEGWAATILVVLLIVATAALLDPRLARPNSAVLLGRIRALLGVAQMRLGIAQVLAAVAAEIALFALLVHSKTDRSGLG